MKASIPHFEIERGLLARGKSSIAGADEAGRGALAGPLAVGFVIFPNEIFISPPRELADAVRDSKMLAPKRRRAARDIILKHALYADVCLLSHRCVDSMNVNGATEFALRRLVGSASIAPDAVILDGKFSFDIGCELISVIDGDAVCFSVAAASILAKVRRDCVMENFEAHYPGYAFAKHKGYGTVLHREIITAHGPSPIHRRSFKPVKSLMERSALHNFDK